MMRKHFKLCLAVLIVVCLVFGCESPMASAAEIGDNGSPPEDDAIGRPLYTEDTRPNFPVFNSMEGEENFLSIIGSDGAITQSGGEALELKLNQEYEVRISYCNDGVPTGIPTYANANDTKVRVEFPFTITSERELTTMITASNSQPETVSATMILVASEPMSLEVIRGTTRIVNNNPTNNDLLSYEELFGDGALIGTNSMIGIVLYGSENAGYVTFKFRTLPLDQSTIESVVTNRPIESVVVTPEPKATEKGPKMTSLIIALGVVLALTVVAWLAYFFYQCRSGGNAQD